MGIVVSFWSLVFIPTGILLMSFFSSKKNTVPISMIFGNLCSRSRLLKSRLLAPSDYEDVFDFIIIFGGVVR